MDFFVRLGVSMFVTTQSLLVPVQNGNNCNNLGNPPTVSSCWDCFQSLLADCDKQNPQGERRDACYKGANNFYVWCLGRISPQPKSSTVSSTLAIQYPEPFSFSLQLDKATRSDDIRVYVRTTDGTNYYQTLVKSYVFSTSDSSFDILVDYLGIEHTILGFTVTDSEHTFANAFAVQQGIRGDLDGDGQITDIDHVMLAEQFAQGKISFDEYLRLVEK